jgi:colanic acid biosynthesis glycosyl transferase WcaI
VIFNGVDVSRFSAEGRSAELRSDLGLPAQGPIALYAGTIGMAHGLDTVVKAAALRPEVHWVIVGEGACKADIEAQSVNVPNVHVLPGQPKSRMAGLYEMSSVCLVPLRDLPLFQTVIPSKIFEIWAMRRPLVLGVRGESAALVERSGGGLVVEPESAEALASAVSDIVSDRDAAGRMGESGRTFVEQHFDRPVLARRYLQVFKDVVAR